MENTAQESEGNNNTGGTLPLISGGQSGIGLPYAPVNWPNAGDNWKWSVGKRIDSQGFHTDRYLYAPPHFKIFGDRRPRFRSQASTRRYLEIEFPDANVDAFFASFTWKIPTAMQVQKEANKVTPTSLKVRKSGTKKAGKQPTASKPAQKRYIFRQRTRGYLKQLPQSMSDNGKTTIDLGSMSEEIVMAIPDSSGSSINDSESHALTDPDVTSPQLVQGSEGAAVIEDFDDYLSSLDDVLTPPPPPPPPPRCSSMVVEMKEDNANTRKKLSGFLGMDLHALLSSEELISEITGLSLELRNDSSLSTLEYHILSLIDEIPEASKTREEINKVEEAVGKFYADLVANVSMATNLKKDYKESQEATAQLQATLHSTSLAIDKIELQIHVLQSKKVKLTSAREELKKQMAHSASKQKMVVECLPKVVQQVKQSHLESSEWELKKKKAAQDKARILAKFCVLKMFRAE